MNIYRKMNEKQIKLLEEAGNIIEDREYNLEEMKQVANAVANHIFSKSKNDISKEVNQYSDILRIIGE